MNVENPFSRAAKSSKRNLASAGPIACSIASAKARVKIGDLRYSSIILSDIFFKEISVRKRYLELFGENHRDDLRMQNLQQRERMVVADKGDEN